MAQLTDQQWIGPGVQASVELLRRDDRGDPGDLPLDRRNLLPGGNLRRGKTGRRSQV
jgi:hypothetical protein